MTPPESATREYGPRPPRAAAEPPGRPRRGAGATLLVVLLGAGLTALAWPAGRTPSRAGAPPPAAWVEVVTELDARRAAAFAAGDPGGLARVYAAGAALDADVAQLEVHAAAGRRVRGLRHELLAVAVVEADSARAVLVVTDRLGPHQLLGPSGEVLRAYPGRGAATWRVELVRGCPDRGCAGGWLVRVVSPL